MQHGDRVLHLRPPVLKLNSELRRLRLKPQCLLKNLDPVRLARGIKQHQVRRRAAARMEPIPHIFQGRRL